MIKYKQLQDEKWLREQIKNKPMRQIASEIGCSYGGVIWTVRKFKIDVPQRIKHRMSIDMSKSCKRAYQKKYPNGRFGKLASNWKGGKRLTGANQRYFCIYQPWHPDCTNDGYVMEHRLVMEKKVGRYLTDGEIVHHKNGNGHDNRIENLELTTKKKHYKEHFGAVKEVDKLKNEIKRLKKILKNNNIIL